MDNIINNIDSCINNVYTNIVRGDNMETKIVKWGNSQGIRLNKELLNQAGISINDNVLIEVNENNELIIKKLRPSIKELFSNYKDDYKLEEFAWGENKGRELW